MTKVNINENFQDTNYRNNIKEKKENYRLKILKKYTMEIVKKKYIIEGK